MRWRPAPGPPRVALALGRAVPGALVRLLPGLAVLGCARLVASGPEPWLLAVAAAVLVTWRPDLPTAAVFTLVAGAMVLAGDDLLGPAAAAGPGPGARPGAGDAEPWRVAGLVLAVHLVPATAALASHIAWRSVVEVAVLRRAARPFLAVQAVTQVLALLALQARGGIAAGDGGEWFRVLAVAGAVAVAVLVLPGEWVSRRRRAGAGPS